MSKFIVLLILAALGQGCAATVAKNTPIFDPPSADAELSVRTAAYERLAIKDYAKEMGTVGGEWLDLHGLEAYALKAGNETSRRNFRSARSKVTGIVGGVLPIAGAAVGAFIPLVAIAFSPYAAAPDPGPNMRIGALVGVAAGGVTGLAIYGWGQGKNRGKARYGVDVFNKELRKSLNLVSAQDEVDELKEREQKEYREERRRKRLKKREERRTGKQQDWEAIY